MVPTRRFVTTEARCPFRRLRLLASTLWPGALPSLRVCEHPAQLSAEPAALLSRTQHKLILLLVTPPAPTLPSPAYSTTIGTGTSPVPAPPWWPRLRAASADVRHARVRRLLEAAYKGDASKLEDILSADPRLVSAAGPRGATALHVAARYGHPQLLRLLLRYGADANALDEKGNSPLMKAVQMRKEEAAAVLRTHAAAAVTAPARHAVPAAHTGSPHRQAVPMLIGGGGLAAPTYRGAPAAPPAARGAPPSSAAGSASVAPTAARAAPPPSNPRPSPKYDRAARSQRTQRRRGHRQPGRRTTVREQRVGPS